MKTIGSKRDYRQEITDSVIQLIESENLVEWAKPWVNYGFPRNCKTGRVYEGAVNQLILGMRMVEMNWKYPLFASFLQIKELGGTVLQGSAGTPILFFNKGKVEDELGEEHSVVISRFYSVFNIEQTDLEPIRFLELVSHDDMTLPEVESFFSKIPVEVEYGGDMAAYSPQLDRIIMPQKEQFMQLRDFYAVLGHEMVHATGHESRLNRITSTKFGSSEYAFEELIAELGSMILCMHTGLEPRLQHGSSYIHGWLNILKQDKQAIFKASFAAGKAVNWLLDSVNK